MATANIYLTFNGNCREAFDFYKSVLGGDFDYLSTFGEMPPQEGMEMGEEDKKRIMHISLPLSKETTLMGCDSSTFFGDVEFGNNFSISLDAESRADADRLFNGLAAGGKIVMPMQDTFWNSYFGMFTDKFGVNWMVSWDLRNDQ